MGFLPLCKVPVLAHQRGELLASLSLPTVLEERHSAMVADTGHVRRLACGLLKQLEPARGVSALEQQPAEGIDDFRPVRYQLVGPPGRVDGPGVVLLVEQSGQVVEHDDVLRLHLEDLLVLLDSRVRLPRLQVGLGQNQAYPGILGMLCKPLA